ncbi:CIA30 family protein [Carboxylicivirga sp. RSCT41]|uniref:CIA30 family protein n=1 Tax=Carboxylicivirga agarovorans TaxID=3417570 RepID=UPI003D3537A0
MHYSILLLLVIMNTTTVKMLHDFNKNDDLSAWTIVNDGVMGGLSKGNISINGEGHGEFSGYISLENNGGFSSLRTRFAPLSVVAFQKIIIRVKGDGKRYQLRVKTDTYDAHSYITYFTTSGQWEEIELDLETFYPSFRGRKLAMSNYPKLEMEELAFLIANKKEESFLLQIDYIQLK